MMFDTIAFIADVHVGNHALFGGPIKCGINSRCQYVLDALTAAAKISEELDALLYVCGDLLDSAKPLPQIIRAVQEALPSTRAAILMGNHEAVSTDSGDNALAPLIPVATVIDKPTVRFDLANGHELWSVPSHPGPVSQWFPGTLETLEVGSRRGPVRGLPAPRTRILAIHLGIFDEDTSEHMRRANDAIGVDALRKLCAKHEIKVVFAGNWHKLQAWGLDGGVGIYQCGALVPTGFNNLGLAQYGHVLIYDTKTKLVRRQTVPGPRFMKVHSVDELHVCQAIEPDTRLFVCGEASGEELDHLRDALEAAKESGRIYRVMTQMSRAGRARIADKVATSTREAATVTAAVASWCRAAASAMPAGVEVADVAEAIAQYLRGVSRRIAKP